MTENYNPNQNNADQAQEADLSTQLPTSPPQFPEHLEVARKAILDELAERGQDPRYVDENRILEMAVQDPASLEAYLIAAQTSFDSENN